MEKQNFKIIWNGKGIQIAKPNLNWKNKVRRCTLTDFKTYYKAPVIKHCAILALRKNKWTKIRPHICGQLIFHKGDKTNHGDMTVFSINAAGKTRYSHAKELSWILTLHHI